MIASVGGVLRPAAAGPPRARSVPPGDAQLPEADAELAQRCRESCACLRGVVLIEGSARTLHGEFLESGPRMGELRRPQHIEQPTGLMGSEHVRHDRPIRCGGHCS